jgi:hypothetical protein
MPRLLYEEADFGAMRAAHHHRLWEIGAGPVSRDFCNSLKCRADKVIQEAPNHLWHGWAIMEAFQAGAAYALDQMQKSND